MNITIKPVKTRRELKKFIVWPEKLYKGCDNWVPPLVGDEFDTFNPKKNDAFDFCECECYLAYRDKKIVGRVAAIINHKANDMWNENSVRFGWLDFIEDRDVLEALLDSVKAYGKVHGCTVVKGPLGFTDMDKEGSLVEGYDNLSPFTCLYNYPYYDTLLAQLGYTKDVDWTQKILEIDPELPAAFQFCDTIEEKFGIHVVKGLTTQGLGKKYGMGIFHMYNEAFAPLFQFAPLTDKQIKSYLSTYVPILDPDFVSVCVDRDDTPVGFAFCVPTLAKAVKKSRGRLFPLGIFRILHALKHNDTLEALMIGVHPDYQGKGAILLMLKQLHENCNRRGVKRLIMNPQLEENFKVQSLFSFYKVIPFMRRRSYKNSIA